MMVLEERPAPISCCHKERVPACAPSTIRCLVCLVSSVRWWVAEGSFEALIGPLREKSSSVRTDVGQWQGFVAPQKPLMYILYTFFRLLQRLRDWKIAVSRRYAIPTFQLSSLPSSTSHSHLHPVWMFSSSYWYSLGAINNYNIQEMSRNDHWKKGIGSQPYTINDVLISPYYGFEFGDISMPKLPSHVYLSRERELHYGNHDGFEVCFSSLTTTHIIQSEHLHLFDRAKGPRADLMKIRLCPSSPAGLENPIVHGSVCPRRRMHRSGVEKKKSKYRDEAIRSFADVS